MSNCKVCGLPPPKGHQWPAWKWISQHDKQQQEQGGLASVCRLCAARLAMDINSDLKVSQAGVACDVCGRRCGEVLQPLVITSTQPHKQWVLMAYEGVCSVCRLAMEGLMCAIEEQNRHILDEYNGNADAKLAVACIKREAQ